MRNPIQRSRPSWLAPFSRCGTDHHRRRELSPNYCWQQRKWAAFDGDDDGTKNVLKMPASYGSTVKKLLSRITRVGFPSAFLLGLLPDWWSPELESEPGALADLKIRLARRLGLDLKMLLSSGDVALSIPLQIKYKRAVRLADSDLNEPFVAYCTALAQTISAAMPLPSRRPNADGDIERQSILCDDRVVFVSLNALLRHCWEDLGIAVVQVPRPTTIAGFDAASFAINGRYVVLLAKQSPYPSWASFLLGHELGHVAAGHIADGEAMVDEPSDQLGLDGPHDSSGAARTDDVEEASADAFALALLAGSQLKTVGAEGSVSPASLASAALSTGKSLRIDPGHLILRFARESGEWGLAQAALSQMHEDVDVGSDINRIALAHLDLASLGGDVREGLVQALNAEAS